MKQRTTIKMTESLNEKELKNVFGGYAPPTKEQMEKFRYIYGPMADIMCW